MHTANSGRSTLRDHRPADARRPGPAGIDQRQLAELSGVSLPTIQRMEASDGIVRGVVDTLIKVIEAFDAAGVELIGDQAPASAGGAACASSSRRRPVTGTPDEEGTRRRPPDIADDPAARAASAMDGACTGSGRDPLIRASASSSPPSSSPSCARATGCGDLKADIVAGLTVAIVALPLSMAIAIASGVTPDRGLYTAIVGGFLVSAARRQPVPDRRPGRRLHRAGGGDRRSSTASTG